jgi:hypothetical protein
MIGLNTIGPYVCCPRVLRMPTPRLAPHSTSKAFCAAIIIWWRVDCTASHRPAELSAPRKFAVVAPAPDAPDLSIEREGYLATLDKAIEARLLNGLDTHNHSLAVPPPSSGWMKP